MNILFLEDDSHGIVQIRQKLIGHSVDYVDNVVEAINKLSEKNYDLLFLDIDLKPEHYYDFQKDYPDTGIEVAKYLSHLISGRYSGVPIIIHSQNHIRVPKMIVELYGFINVRWIPFPILLMNWDRLELLDKRS